MPAPAASNLSDPRHEVNGKDASTWLQPGHPMIRMRPWAPAGAQQLAQIKAQHNQPMPPLGNFTSHALRDSKGVMISCTSGDMPLVNGQAPTYSDVHIFNFEIYDIARSGPTSGEHCDAVWADGSYVPAIMPDLLIERGYIHDTDGSVQNLLICGTWDTITIRNIVCERVGNVGTIKATANLVLIDGCPGLKLNIQGDAGQAKICNVRNSPGAQINAIDGSTVKINFDSASGGIVVPGPAVVPPAPPVAPAVVALPPLPNNVAALVVVQSDGTITSRRSGDNSGVTVQGLFDKPLKF